MSFGVILGRFGDHDRGDETRISTRGDRSNSRAHRHIVSRRWRLKQKARAQTFGLLDWATITKTDQTSRKTEDTLETLIAASRLLVPRVALEGSLRPPKRP